MILFQTNCVHGLIAATTLIQLFTEVQAIDDRCEITDPCVDASNCPILQNYEEYDPDEAKKYPERSINFCIETICQEQLESEDSSFKKFYFNQEQESLIINIQCWDNDSFLCYSIQEYGTVEKSI